MRFVKSSTLSLFTTNVGTMICFVAGIADLSPFRTCAINLIHLSLRKRERGDNGSRRKRRAQPLENLLRFIAMRLSSMNRTRPPLVARVSYGKHCEYPHVAHLPVGL